MRNIYMLDARADPQATTIGILTAVRIATHFVHRLPTVKELQQHYGMSRPTAYRWRSAFKTARGIA